ncbi:hypothetical protein JHK87_018958 [Glycine soja]|nr:hypothetical protein JHK87_018958 [Glycine soja]
MARFQEVPITDGKFNDWCKPWKNSFMITMLGKRVRFHQLEAKLNCSWTRKGFIKIIDVPREYYQFLFTSNEDYNHALMEVRTCFARICVEIDLDSLLQPKIIVK